MTKPISQREARHLRRRARELEAIINRQKNAWAETWPGGTNITTISVLDVHVTAVRVARLLGHACVATVTSDGQIAIHALPLGSGP